MNQEPSLGELQLFGDAVVVGKDGPVRLSPSQLALLAIVYAEEEVGRPRIARILWRADDDPKIRHRIRQLLHQIIRRVGEGVLVARGDTLSRGTLASDYGRLQEAVEDGRLRDAARILDQGFIAGGLGTVKGEFADWAAAQSQRLVRELRGRGARKWDEARRDNRWEEARDAAECLYLLDAERADVVQRVVEARARAGKISLAEAAYAQYVEDLPRGVVPDAGVERVIENARRLRENEPDSADRAPPPFVGRAEALEAGRHFIDRMKAGGFHVLVVSGEPGIGKTRVLGEIEREAVLGGFRCLSASPIELEHRIPLNPIVDALKAVDLRPHLAALGEPWNRVVTATLPAGSYDEWAGDLPPIREESLPRRLLDAYALLFERLAAEEPTILFIDDAHWADATTVSALQFAQRRWPNISFGVVAGLRTGMNTPVGAAATYLEDQEGLDVSRTGLTDLSGEEAIELIEGIGRGRIEPSAVERLSALAGPHPLYLTELSRDYLSGALDLNELPPTEVTIPVSLQQIFTARINALAEESLRIAGLLAVSSRAMRLKDVAALSGLGLDLCTEHVEELERARLVEVVRDAVRIPHDLFRLALYKGLSEARRVYWHGGVAELLRGIGGEGNAGELALHLSRAGESEEAIEFGWIAANEAWESGAMSESARFLELIVELVEDPHDLADVTGRIAQALYLNREIDRAIAALDVASERLRAVNRVGPALRLEIKRIAALASADASPIEDLLPHLEHLRGEAERDGDWEAVALALFERLRLLHRQGATGEIHELFGQLEELAARGGSARVLSLSGLGMRALFGDPRDGLICARAAVEEAPSESEHRLTALLNLLVVLQFQGRILLPEAREIIEEARFLAGRSGDRAARFGLEGNLALAYLDAGEVDRATALMQPATSDPDDSGLDLARFGQPVNLGELALAQDEFEEASTWFELAEQSLGKNSPRYARDIINSGIGLCALSRGNLSEARRREALLSEPPDPWYYDPTTRLTFGARLLEMRGRRRDAICRLEDQLEEIRPRHVFAWLKLSRLSIMLQQKERQMTTARARAEECLTLSLELGLSARAKQFEQLLERLGA